jgi:hypothetical protein
MNSKLTRIVISLLLVLIIGGLTARPAYAMPPHCRLPADAGWIDCSIDLVEGERTRLSAHGMTITANLRDFPDSISGPDGQVTDCWMFDGISPCVMENEPYGTLIGKIGPTGEPFVIGSDLTFVPETSGRLYVIVNDNIPFYDDNHGRYIVYWVYTP